MAELMTAQKFARGLIRLLKEYATKLEALNVEVSGISKIATGRSLESAWMGVQSRFGPLKSALLNTTREASQLAEQGDVEDISRVELQVRLAEVEGLLQMIERRFSIGP